MADEYVDLMASLPALGPMLAARYAPINRVRLQSRLRQLRPEHQAELAAVVDLLAWRRLPLAGTDSDLVRRARRIIPTLENAMLATLAGERLELRTLIAALRRREQGEDSPPGDPDWGYGRFVHMIAANWRDPDFGLSRRYPFVLSARELLKKDDVRGFERLVLEAAWRQAERHAIGHTFNFEAVALYLVRWNLLDRWIRYDAEAAAARFDTLVDAALQSAAPAFKQAGLTLEDTP